ncbi:MAG: helix-hairpin-helix domain-containing protein [Deltaproteobacteria bacterium]|nr:MAG: helix-hairpin-helix domain-containing protein [Deltaproteobacteria bacterium]
MGSGAHAARSCGARRLPGGGPGRARDTASRRAIEKLPGITPSMARRVVEGRPYEEPHELVERRILTEREFRRVADRVTAGRNRR